MTDLPPFPDSTHSGEPGAPADVPPKPPTDSPTPASSTGSVDATPIPPVSAPTAESPSPPQPPATAVAPQTSPTPTLEGLQKAVIATPAVGAPSTSPGPAKRNARPSDTRGFSPLHKAAQNGDREKILALLEKGDDPLAVDHLGNTPLHRAAESGNVEALQALLDHLNKGKAVQDDLACRPSQSEAVGARTLGPVNKPPETGVNHPNFLQQTPLHVSVEESHLHIVEILLRNGASILAKDKFGDTPLHLAAERNLEEISDILLKNGANPGEPNFFGDTPIHRAAREGNLKLLDLFSAIVKSPDIPDFTGITPLHLAAKSGNLEAVEFLVKKGANVRARDVFGATVLHKAAASGNLEVINFLLERKADPTEKANNGFTPAETAAFFGFPDAELMLSPQKDPDEAGEKKAESRLEETPSTNTPEPEDKHGFLSRMRGKRYKAPSIFSSAWNHLHLAFFAPREKFHEMVERGSVNQVKSLVRQFPALVNHGDDRNFGEAPLHKVARLNFVFLGKFLLENGADPDRQTYDGWTPLHKAAFWNSVGMTKLLLEFGADYNLRDAFNETPLSKARAKGHTEIANLLLKAGPGG